MKHFIKIFLLSLCFSGMFSVINAQAVYNKTLWNPGNVKVDLNRDGKTELIKLRSKSNDEYDVAGEYILQITSNGRTIMNRYVDGVAVSDIYSGDRYIEIITVGGTYGGLRIYRYDGKKVSLYASASLFSGNMSSLKKLLVKKNYCYWTNDEYRTAIQSDGKGSISWGNYYELYSDNSYTGNLRMYYRVTKNSICYKRDGYAVEMEKSYCHPSRPWIAYKYPRMEQNKKVFIIRRGEAAKIIKWKITSKYIYIQVRRGSTQETGWVAFEPKDYYLY